jgi:hypothetical protein
MLSKAKTIGLTKEDLDIIVQLSSLQKEKRIALSHSAIEAKQQKMAEKLSVKNKATYIIAEALRKGFIK